MSGLGDAMRVVSAVREFADETELELRSMKTPQAAFEESQAVLNAGIDTALNDHHSAQTAAEATKFRADILRLSTELSQLSETHQNTLDEKNKEYQRQLHLIVDNFGRNLVSTLGVDLIKKSVRELAKDPSTSTSRVNGMPTPSTTEVESPIEPQPGSFFEDHGPTETGPSSSRKRTDQSDFDTPGPRKRQRTVRSGRKEGTIWYDQVFQNGRAPTKHIMVEYPKDSGQWYIIRCQECNRDFKDKPLVSGGSHLGSAVHNLPRDAAHVIEQFGIAVIGCSPALAQKNNEIARRSFQEEEKNGRTDSDGQATGTRHNLRGGPGVVYPKPGQIYLGYWEKAKKSWPVLLLPPENLDEVGVPETLESLRLLDNLPPCYHYDEFTQKLAWQDGFEDGGREVAHRQFPVIYFDDDLEFPSRSEVSWLSAGDLESFDIHSPGASDIPHIRSAREYLKKRAALLLNDPDPNLDSRNDTPDVQSETPFSTTPETHNAASPEPDTERPLEAEIEILSMQAEGFGQPEQPLLQDSVDESSENSSLAGASRVDDPPKDRHDVRMGDTVPAPDAPDTSPIIMGNVTRDKHDTAESDCLYAEVTMPHSPQTCNTEPAFQSQANVSAEPSAEPDILVRQSSIEADQEPPPLADYLRSIARDSLKQDLDHMQPEEPRVDPRDEARCPHSSREGNHEIGIKFTSINSINDASTVMREQIQSGEPSSGRSHSTRDPEPKTLPNIRKLSVTEMLTSQPQVEVDASLRYHHFRPWSMEDEEPPAAHDPTTTSTDHSPAWSGGTSEGNQAADHQTCHGHYNDWSVVRTTYGPQPQPSYRDLPPPPLTLQSVTAYMNEYGNIPEVQPSVRRSSVPSPNEPYPTAQRSLFSTSTPVDPSGDPRSSTSTPQIPSNHHPNSGLHDSADVRYDWPSSMSTGMKDLLMYHCRIRGLPPVEDGLRNAQGHLVCPCCIMHVQFAVSSEFYKHIILTHMRRA